MGLAAGTVAGTVGLKAPGRARRGAHGSVAADGCAHRRGPILVAAQGRVPQFVV